MVHDGNESLQLHIAIQLIDGLLLLVVRWPDVHRKALRVRNALHDWMLEKRTPTGKEWQFVMEDTKTIQDWLQDKAKEMQDFIDSPEPQDFIDSTESQKNEEE